MHEVVSGILLYTYFYQLFSATYTLVNDVLIYATSWP